MFWCRYQCDRVKVVKLILTPIVYIYIYSGKIDIKTVDTQQQQQQTTNNKQKNKQNKYKKQNEAKNYKTKLKQNKTKSKQNQKKNKTKPNKLKDKTTKLGTSTGIGKATNYGGESKPINQIHSISIIYEQYA